jgi:hypothetical protein
MKFSCCVITTVKVRRVTRRMCTSFVCASGGLGHFCCEDVCTSSGTRPQAYGSTQAAFAEPLRCREGSSVSVVGSSSNIRVVACAGNNR